MFGDFLKVLMEKKFLLPIVLRCMYIFEASFMRALCKKRHEKPTHKTDHVTKLPITYSF